MKTLLKKITVLYNLPSGNNLDDLDTQKSALEVAEGLKQAGYVTNLLGITTGEISKVKNIKADLVFNLVEWAGRDYVLGVEVIKNLEAAALPYTGSNAKGYELSCNKVLMKKQLDIVAIPTPKWQIIDNLKPTLPAGGFKIENLEFPMIVKPTLEHSAIGISQASVCINELQLKEQVKKLLDIYNQPILVEQYLEGDEAQVTVLEKHGKPWVLPPAVFRYQTKPGYWPINTYEAKWDDTHWEGQMSAWTEDVDPKLIIEMQDLAKKCYLHLAGRSYPRIDMRINNDRVYVLEVNNNPGIDFDPESGITVSAKKAELDWSGLLTNIVQEAYDPIIV